MFSEYARTITTASHFTCNSSSLIGRRMHAYCHVVLFKSDYFSAWVVFELIGLLNQLIDRLPRQDKKVERPFYIQLLCYNLSIFIVIAFPDWSFWLIRISYGQLLEYLDWHGRMTEQHSVFPMEKWHCFHYESKSKATLYPSAIKAMMNSKLLTVGF